MVTLTGAGGIGKTRLAVAVAEQLEDRYPQRAVFVALASIAQPELVLPRIAAAVGASIEGSRRALDVLVEHLGETPTLLVLDNLEQVVGVAPELDELIQELRQRADELNDRAKAELLLISAVTAAEVGDDDGALAALEGLERLEERIDDPYLASAAQLAVSWVVPILGDFDGALQAASTALDGFRQQNVPFKGWAALTVGLLEMTLGRDDAARAHLTEANELGGQFGNHWLESSARTQLASLAVRVGRLEVARVLLVDSVHASEDAKLSTQTVTFSLVAFAQLALAEGDARRAATALGAADGLRKLAGLRAWPSMRRGEGELVNRVTQKLDPEVFRDAVAAGSELNRREAVAFVASINGK